MPSEPETTLVQHAGLQPLDYAAVVKRLQAFAADHPHQLMERYAQAIADLLMGEFGAPWVRVRVAKLAPLAGVKELGIVIERGKH